MRRTLVHLCKRLQSCGSTQPSQITGVLPDVSASFLGQAPRYVRQDYLHTAGTLSRLRLSPTSPPVSLMISSTAGRVPVAALHSRASGGDKFEADTGGREGALTEGGGTSSSGEDWPPVEKDWSLAAEQLFNEDGSEVEVDDAVFHSLVLGRDVRDAPGLPPLEDLLSVDERAEAKALRREIERRKQEEIARKRVRKVNELGQAYAVGRRKTSSARVWLGKGDGLITVNGQSFSSYFPDWTQRVELLLPFMETGTMGHFSVNAKVVGGGISGQAGALRHAISRSLENFEPSYRPVLKSAGFLRRDPRMVERKKPGRAKARKSFQWVKR